jgi:hypothetical protein
MSGWQELKAEKNRRSLVRLTKALPPISPRVVLARALARPFVPPTPQLAIESYWRAHPIRADRLARALAARGQAPEGLAAGGPEERLAFHVPYATRAIPGRRARIGSGILLRVRPTGLSLRLAR